MLNKEFLYLYKKLDSEYRNNEKEYKASISGMNTDIFKANWTRESVGLTGMDQSDLIREQIESSYVKFFLLTRPHKRPTKCIVIPKKEKDDIPVFIINKVQVASSEEMKELAKRYNYKSLRNERGKVVFYTDYTFSEKQ